MGAGLDSLSAAADVCYIGLCVGDTGNNPADTYVDAADRLGCRANPHDWINRAPVTDAYDFNRDSEVNAADRLVARAHVKGFMMSLALITAP